MGWQNDSDSNSDESLDKTNGDQSSTKSLDDDDSLEILRDAHKLARAAKANPIRGQTPRVRFVMTRLSSGRVKEIDANLWKIRATGALVQCFDDIPENVDLDAALLRMQPEPTPPISHVLNVDYTILRGLVSDISHYECTPDDKVRIVRESIEAELAVKFLPAVLYPTIKSAPMVCINEIVEQLNE